MRRVISRRVVHALSLVLYAVSASLAWATPPTLHAIIVADTTDNTIGVSVKIDLQRWQDQLTELKTAIGSEITIVKHIIQPPRWGGVDVSKVCAEITVEPDDAVLFAFSGHGFYTLDMKSRWPAMALMDQSDGSPDNLELMSVYRTLSAKQPRLLIVLGDCCNSLMPRAFLKTPGFGGFPLKAERFRELYLQAHGGWIASACQQGKKSFAYGTDKDGGFFTKALIHRLDSAERSDQPASWDTIFEELTEEPVFTANDGKEQIPQFEKSPN